MCVPWVRFDAAAQRTGGELRGEHLARGDLVGVANDPPVGGAGDAPAAGQHVDRIEGADPGLEAGQVALLGGEQLRDAFGEASGDERQSPVAVDERAPSGGLEAVDPEPEPLVGALDRGVGAPGDAVGAVAEGPFGCGQPCSRRARRTAAWRCSTAPR